MSSEFQDASDQESNQRKKRKQASSTDLGKDLKRGGIDPPQRTRPGALKRGETCEDLKRLVNENSSDQSYQTFLNDQRRSDYFKKSKSRTKAIKANIFHEMVFASKDWDRADIAKVLVRLLKKPEADKVNSRSSDPFGREELLEEDFDDGTPILQALTSGSNRNLAFVEEILQLDPPPSNLGKIFWNPSQYSGWRYCLHAAIFAADAEHGDFRHIHEIIRHIREYRLPRRGGSGKSYKLTSPFEARQTASGDTPLHLAIKKAPIDSKVLDDPEEAATTTAGIANGVTKATELIKALINANPKALGVKNKAKNSLGSKGRTPYQERIFQLGLEFHNWKLLRTKDVPTEPHDNDVDCTRLNGARLGFPENANGVVGDGENRGEAAHGAGLEERFLVRKYFWTDEFRNFVISDPIASYISYYCITKLDRDKAMACLYRRGEELATEFDLLGFPRQTITKDYLESLETHVRFERTLKYVALPRLAVEASANPTLSSQSQSSPGRKGFADMTALFQWLRDRHVRKIQKVTVDDNESPSHQDCKIVECLSDFDVELWDWEKMDLSSEVIWKSSKSIRQIWLHSSGNQAVLEGWCAPGGFGDRGKFPELTDIYIYFHEDQEDKDTLEERGNVVASSLETRKSEALVEQASQSELAKGFVHGAVELIDQIMRLTTNTNELSGLQARVEELRTQVNNLASSPTKEDLRVVFNIVPRGACGGSSMGDRRIANPSENERISRVKELTSFFRNAKVNEKSASAVAHRVKIAIIDDGLDSSLYIIDRKHSKVFAGQSFCNSSSEFMSSYYVPSGNHGTQVASLICQICPEVDICIARLDEQYTRNGNRVIQPLSAQKAVEWATECGVDIICMSWTIERSDGSSGLEGLEKAIDKAKKRGIIMFCSASDQGGSSKVFCYPGAFKGDNCIRIGSCSSSDFPSVWVNSNQVDFLLPGENIVIRNSDGTSEHQTGSSFATAVAAGLGGLLIYCTLKLGIGIPPSAKGPNDDEAGDKENDNHSDSEGDPNDSDGDTAANGKKEDHPFSWNRSLMYSVFSHMSIFPDNSCDVGLLKPESFIIEELKKQLKTGKSLDKLNWNQKSEDALKKIMEDLRDPPKDSAWNPRSRG